MIQRTRQQWTPSAVVKVGFLTLRVISMRAVVDGMPDIYTLESLNGATRYEFIPHNGLTKIDTAEGTLSNGIATERGR